MKITNAQVALALVGLAAGSLPRLEAQAPHAPKAPSLGITVGVKATTLGFGPEVGYLFGHHLGIRGGFQMATISRDVTVSNIAYSGSIKWRTFHALLDLYLAGPLRLSAGIINNNNKVEISADPTVSEQIGDSTYTASQIGTITGTITFKKGAPYLGIGLGGKSRVGFIMDLGVMMQGTPIVGYTATTTLSGAAQTTFTQEADKEKAKVQTELDGKSYLKAYPVLGIGLQVKF